MFLNKPAVVNYTLRPTMVGLVRVLKIVGFLFVGNVILLLFVKILKTCT